MQDFRNLAVWQKAHALTLQTYRATECFPRAELFGLTIQLRRSSASIAANLAEGCVRTRLEFARFVQIALGSASETEYHFLLARDLRFLAEREYVSLSEQVAEVKRMLSSLQQRIQRDSNNASRSRSKNS